MEKTIISGHYTVDGAGVNAVFEEKRSGKITDVKHFLVID